MNDTITLYPKNWLYNAGVIGLLKVLSSKINIDSWLKDDGSLDLDLVIFHRGKFNIPNALVYYVEYLTEDENIEEWLDKTDKNSVTNREKYKKFYDQMGDFGYRLVRAFNKLFRSNMPYQNLVQESEWQEFIEFVGKLANVNQKGEHYTCDLCGEEKAVGSNSGLKERLFRFGFTHSKLLGPSISEFPNSFWNNKASFIVCPLCAFLLIHHHIALTKLSDGSEIFINAPSFKLMWYLNKYVKEIFEREKIQAVRQLLGMSLIEMALKLNLQLGKWTMMNIEVVIKRESEIDFFSLPLETVTMLLDRDIATQLRDIGEISILDLFLEGRYKEILEVGERILEIALKSDRGKQDDHFINHYIKLGKNKEKGKKNKNLIVFAQNLFKLYAFIEEKVRGGLAV